MKTQSIEDVKNKIRDVKDFPKQGIIFRDITTALKDSETLKVMVDYLCDQFKDVRVDYIAGIESRGFIFGMPMAYKMNAGFVPVRKPNKLPAATYSQEYELEYGTDKIEIHQDAFPKGANVLIVDDLLATGGTAEAACKLIKKAGANLIGIAFLIELEALNGREKLVADIGHDDPHRVGGRLGQRTRGKARHIPLLARDGHHTRARLLRDGAFAVEHLRDGGRTDSRKLRYVID